MNMILNISLFLALQAGLLWLSPYCILGFWIGMFFISFAYKNDDPAIHLWLNFGYHQDVRSDPLFDKFDAKTWFKIKKKEVDKDVLEQEKK